MSAIFNNKVAKQIAEKNFGDLLDCLLGYSDSGYSLNDDVAIHEQNFAEDLEELGIVVNNQRLQVVSNRYKEMVKKFELSVRKKYPSIYKQSTP